MTFDRRRWIFAASTIVALAGGCGGDAGPSKPAGPEKVELHVAAASDLQTALPVLAAAFKQAGNDVEIVPTFGSSGQLARQIGEGLPVDVFLSANRAFVDALAEKNVIKPGTVRPYARGVLVLVVGQVFASEFKIKVIADLDRPEVKHIAIGDVDKAPYGLAAKQALERAGLWEKFQPRIVQAGSVRQALQFVESGNVEAGFVGRAIVDPKKVSLVPIPLDSCDPIIQALGVVAKPKHPDEARAFVEFLLGDVGQGIFRDLGFKKVEAEAPPAKKDDEAKPAPKSANPEG